MLKKYNGHKITIHKMGLGAHTDDGPFWAEVDDSRIGINGRMSWWSKEEALAASKQFIDTSRNLVLEGPGYDVVGDARRKIVKDFEGTFNTRGKWESNA